MHIKKIDKYFPILKKLWKAKPQHIILQGL